MKDKSYGSMKYAHSFAFISEIGQILSFFEQLVSLLFYFLFYLCLHSKQKRKTLYYGHLFFCLNADV